MDGQTATIGLVVIIIIAALAFDYTNGFHDAANSIATVVATRVLSPGLAVIWAGFFNFIAVVVFGTAVAKTIGGDMINIAVIPADDRLYVLLAGVLGAIAWNLITWYFGLPTSSSHALVGAYAGSAIASYMWHFGPGSAQTVLIAEGWIKTLAFIVLSPMIGMILGYIMMVAVYWIFRKVSVRRIDRWFRVGQLFSAAAYSLGHGGNDAQKTMGIITIVLVAGGFLQMTPAGNFRKSRDGWNLLPARRSLLEHCQAGGALLKQWAQRSSNYSLFRASALRRPGPSHFSRRPLSAYLFRQHIRSLALSLVSAPQSDFRLSSGALRDGSFGLGF